MSRKRHESLIPLSHQHHHGLVLSRRLQRALPDQRENRQAVAALAGDVISFFDRDLVPYFEAEEEAVFPMMEQHLGRLAIIDELRREHRQMERLVNTLRRGNPARQVETLRTFGLLLNDHIRKEERILFPIFERQLPPSAAKKVGDRVQQKLNRED